MRSRQDLVTGTKHVRWVLALGLLAGSWAGGSSPGRLSGDLEALDAVAAGEGRVDVIVTYRGGPGAAARRRLVEAGAEHRRDLPLVGAIAARVPVGQLRRLATDPGVQAIMLDEEIRPFTDVAVPAAGIALARAATGVDGAGVRVAVVDSGVLPVAGLGADPPGGLAAWVDLVSPRAPAAQDPYGHGTHVAGVIAGAAIELHDPGRRRTYGGVAPGAEIVSVRVLDRTGRGRVSDAVAGLEWVLEHAAELNIRVVNLSFGHEVRTPLAFDPLAAACERLWEAGLVVVASAGNMGREGPGYGTITSPGNSPHVLTVGALDDRGTWSRSDDRPTSYSSRGPTRFDGVVKPDLLAPGEDLASLRSPRSHLDRWFPDNRVGSTSRGAASPELFRLSGTSMAAAMVSGAAALLIGRDPSMSPHDVKARLMRSAEKLEGVDVFTRGAGALDVMAALDLDGGVAGSVSPVAVRDDLEVRLFQGAAWSTGPGWDLAGVYGPEPGWDAGQVWSLATLWHPAPSDGAQVVWQVPGPEDLRRDSLWRRTPGAAPHGVVWQMVDGPGRSGDGMEAESVVWQGRPDRSSPLAPDDALLSNESVVWQARPSEVGGGGDPITAESVVWQQTDRATRILIRGDDGVAP